MHASDARDEPAPPLSPLPEGILCPECSYDLRGSTSERCPECGFELAGLRSSESAIPWVHRGELGWFRAYWKTVWLGLRRPKRLCQEIARPVSHRDAQLFRWITAAHAYTAWLLGSIAIYIAKLATGGVAQSEVWVIGLSQIWVFLLLAGLPGLASYFFQSRRLGVEGTNRTIALSYYAWAPLALLVTALPLHVAFLCTDASRAPLELRIVLFCLTFAICVGAPLLVDRSIAAFLKHLLIAAGWPRFFRMIVLRAAGLAFALLAAVFTLSIFYIVLIVYTLL